MFVLDEEEMKKFSEEKKDSLTWICGYRKAFPDDVEGRCDVCGAKIYHRPFSKGRKICIECARKELGDEKFEELVEKAAKELLRRLRRATPLTAM